MYNTHFHSGEQSILQSIINVNNFKIYHVNISICITTRGPETAGGGIKGYLRLIISRWCAVKVEVMGGMV